MVFGGSADLQFIGNVTGLSLMNGVTYTVSVVARNSVGDSEAFTDMVFVPCEWGLTMVCGVYVGMLLEPNPAYEADTTTTLATDNQIDYFCILVALKDLLLVFLCFPVFSYVFLCFPVFSCAFLCLT